MADISAAVPTINNALSPTLQPFVAGIEVQIAIPSTIIDAMTADSAMIVRVVSIDAPTEQVQTQSTTTITSDRISAFNEGMN